MRIISLTVAAVLAIICSGCSLFGLTDPLDQAMNRAETDIDQTALKIHNDATNATAEMNELAHRLSNDTHREIQTAAAQVRQIANETVQLTGQEARCTMKYAGMSAEAKLRNIIHVWKKEPEETTALLCSITPNPITLGTDPATLEISGAWLNNTRPKIQMVSVDDQGHISSTNVPNAARYLSVSTEYSETVRLDDLRKDGLLTEHVRTLHLVFDGLRNGLGEIPVIPSPTCTDHIRNGMETDVDCGGPKCGSCTARKMCTQASDCSSKVCMAGVCGAHKMQSTRNPFELNYGGGPGGNVDVVQSCPAGTAAVGFSLRAGKYIDAVGLICRRINQDGEVEGDVFYSPQAGEGRGEDKPNALCEAAGTVLVGFHGWTGDWQDGRVDSIQGICAYPLEVSKGLNPRQASNTRLIRDKDSGGTERTVLCQNQNEVVTEVHARHGDELDHLYFKCTGIENFVPGI